MKLARLILVFGLSAPALSQLTTDQVLVQFGNVLHQINLDGTVHQVHTLPHTTVKGVGILPDGRWVYVTGIQSGVQDDVIFYDPRDGTHEVAFEFLGDSLQLEGVGPDGSLYFTEWTAGFYFTYGVRLDHEGASLGGFGGFTHTDGNFYDYSGVTPDLEGGAWVEGSHITNRIIRHLDANGNQLLVYQPLYDFDDLTISADGRCWLLESDGRVKTFTGWGSGYYPGITGGRIATIGDATVAFDDGTTELKLFTYFKQSAGTIAKPAGIATSLHTVHREPLGGAYCSSPPNSTGKSSALVATGFLHAADNEFRLYAHQLPKNEACLFLNAPGAGFVPNPGGSSGNLCLGGSIARHLSQVGFSTAVGTFQADVDLSALPQSNGTHQVLPGETWYFQLWHRDFPTSNFTNAVAVTFQ